MKLQSTDDQLMVMAAHRYCLGRQSYIVSSCIAWLRAHWGQLDLETRNVILRDTIEALIEERAGDKSIDAPEWLSFAQWAASQAPADSESWVRRQVAFRQNGSEVMEKVFRPSVPAP